MDKAKYRTRNWKDYNKSLEERGSIEIWFDQKAIKKWHPSNMTGKKGRPQKYGNIAITCALMIRYVYSLGLRQTQGFIRSLIKSLELDISEPDYTTICKRQHGIDIPLLSKHRNAKKLYLLVDGSGLKVYGEGEWKVRMHGHSKRRTWRKIHIGLGITVAGKMRIEVMKLTKSEKTDQEMLPEMLDEVEGEIKKTIGDGAYDTKRCYKAASKKGTELITPPRKGSTTNYLKNGVSPPMDMRNKTVRAVRKEGMANWKKDSGYHIRSLVENTFFRLKTILGDRLSSRKFANQTKEALIKCAILNRMSDIGMPDSYKVV